MKKFLKGGDYMPYFETIGGSIDGPRYITTIDRKIQNKDVEITTDSYR